MDINSLTNTLVPPTNGGANGGTQANSIISSDFETFLQMLTAQARFQDPLEPIDSTEYASQLAQFSMVEQQVMSNDLLTSLAAQLGSNNMAQMAGWIGMEARTTGPTLFEGDPIALQAKPAAAADAASLVVYDSTGTEVQRLTIPVANGTVSWDGTGDNSGQLPDGLYRFEIESRAGGEVIATQRVDTYNRVTEARLEGSETILVLSTSVEIPSTDVTGLREPQTS